MAPIINIGGDDSGTDYDTLVAPADDGVGTAVDISAQGAFHTVQVGESFTGDLSIEVSADAAGLYYATVMSFQNPGTQNWVGTANWARVRRSGVTRYGSLPIVNIGGGSLNRWTSSSRTGPGPAASPS